MNEKAEEMLTLYNEIKAQYPRHVVLLRMGDFYRAIGEDADILSEICDCIKIRPGGKGPWMASFPYHAAEYHIKQLLEAGHYVALADPQDGKVLLQALRRY